MAEKDRYLLADGDIELNENHRRVTLTARNTGDRAIQVGSHYHFYEANRALEFDRERAYGMHLDIAAGTAVRFEPGDAHEVTLVEYGGALRVVGFAGLVNGGLRAYRTHRIASTRLAEDGFKDKHDPKAVEHAAGAPATSRSRSRAAKASKSTKTTKPSKARKG